MVSLSTSFEGTGTGNAYDWHLGQRTFMVSRANVALDTLTFDSRNQRIQHALRISGLDPLTADQWEIRGALGEVERDHINKLYWQIAEAGGLISPLVIDTAGVVYEGNCRLAALQRLCHDYPENQGFCEPPCEVLPEDFDEEARLLFLGDCHVAGKQKWDAQEIAEHVHRMVTKLNKSHDFVARTLRMSKGTVGRYVDAYEMHMAYLRKYPSPGNQYKWSYFFEFQKKKALRERRREDPTFEERFGNWLENGRLGRGEDVRRLPEILEDTEAMNLVDTAGFKAAWQHYQARVAADHSSGFLSIMEQAIRGLETLPARDMELFGRSDTKAEELLRRLHERVCLVARLAQVDLEVTNETIARRY